MIGGGFVVPVRMLPSSWSQRAGSWARAALRMAVICGAGGMLGLASAQSVGQFGPGSQDAVGPPERSVAEWLVRLQQASRWPAYSGTFVVSSSSGALSSARIWHASEGDTQIERVESLTGVPRQTYRRNESVVTFFPQARVVREENRESGGVFPSLLQTGESFDTASFYIARQLGNGRVAGFDADIVLLAPRDEMRFSYRIWSEKKTGLVVKTQTLDGNGRVLEQAAFSELTLDAPVQIDKLKRMMSDTQGYRVEKPHKTKTTAAAEGWHLKPPVAGFKAQNCYRHSPSAPTRMVQCIFSDGLATVSLFLESFNRDRHVREARWAMGATHTMTKHIVGSDGEWWVTAVGEVPAQTLQEFVDSLRRVK